MKKFVKNLTIISIMILVISFIWVYIIYTVTPTLYKNNYQKGYVYQYNALDKSISENRNIVIGGSYMTFATDIDQLTNETGRESYILGIHSGMGMPYIIETAKKYAKKGDTIIFSLRQYEPKQYGMNLINLTLDGESNLFIDFFKKHPFEFIKAALPFTYIKSIELTKRYLFHLGGDFPINNVYDARAFDVNTGNLIYERDNCIALYDDLYKNYNFLTADYTEECFDDINNLISYCNNNDIKIYFIHYPFFEGFTLNTKEEILKHQKYIYSKINGQFLSDILDVSFPKDYVYNGDLHMNDRGKEEYTRLISNALNKLNK